jgi:enterochelin esterase-like enzyme
MSLRRHLRSPVPSIVIVCLGSMAQADESPRIEALRNASGVQRVAALAEFWRSVDGGGTPLVEDVGQGLVRVTILWRGAEAEEGESNVGLIGSFVPGGSREWVRLARVPGTDVLSASLTVDARARYRYYLAWPEGRTRDRRSLGRIPIGDLTYELFDDPRSRQSFPDEYEGATVRTSYFEGPDAPGEPWLTGDPLIPKGEVKEFEVESRILGNRRPVSVYTPAGYPAGRDYPMFLLFDRADYLTCVPTPVILDNLIASGDVPPLVAVLVGPVDREHRSEELAPNARFADFVVRELLPRVRSRYRVTRDPRRIVVGGSSLGGLASAYLAYRHPETFGNVLSMSGSYWWYPAVGEPDGEEPVHAGSGWLPRLYAARARVPTRFYASVGLGEGDGMLAPNRLFRDILGEKRVALRYEEFHGDHSYLNWRGSMVAGLRELLGEPRTLTR